MVWSIQSLLVAHRRLAVCVPLAAGALSGIWGCDDVANPRPALAGISESRSASNDSGQIRLKYICGNQYRIRNFGADTATVTWQVRGTDERGVILLRGRGVAAFSDTMFVTQQSGLVQLFADGKVLQAKGGVQKACVDKPRLTVITERGVVETHKLRDRTYHAGAVVSYAFQAKSGFTNVMVTLDGAYVPAVGKVTMSEDHVLIASADSVVRLTAQEQQLSNTIKEVVTGPDPVAAYRALLTRLAGVANQADADGMVQRAAYVAYDPITDSAALRRADETLANHVFTVASSQSGASNARIGVPGIRAQKVGRADPALNAGQRAQFSIDVAGGGVIRDTLEPATFMYVNGIFTAPEKSAQTLVRLQGLLRQIPRFKQPPFAMAHFYNRSMMRQYESPSQRKAACAASLKMRMSFLGSRSWAPFLKRCYNEHAAMPPVDNDVTEALTQYAQVLLHLPVNIADADVLADTLQQYRSRGRHLVLLPHSQGNMMVQQAMNVLRSTYTYSEQRDSVGITVVPMAAPTSKAWPFPLERIKPVTVQGDIVPLLGGNTWPRIATPAGTALMAEIDTLSLRAFANPIMTSYVAMRRIAVGVQLHDVDESYLSGIVGAAVRDSAASSYGEVAVGELSLALTTDQLIVGQGRNLPLYMTVYNQNDRGLHKTVPLKGRDIAWRSTNDAAAAVNDGGRVSGVGTGGAVVWGRTWGDSAAVAYTVQGVSTDLTGTYAGIWETLDYNIPYVQGPASMTLVVSGSTVNGMVSWTSGGRQYSSKILSSTVDPSGNVANITLQGPDPEAVWLGKRCIGDPNTPTPNGDANVGAGGGDCYQVISVHLSGNDLVGTSYGVGPVWNRSWWLHRTQ